MFRFFCCDSNDQKILHEDLRILSDSIPAKYIPQLRKLVFKKKLANAPKIMVMFCQKIGLRGMKQYSPKGGDVWRLP